VEGYRIGGSKNKNSRMLKKILNKLGYIKESLHVSTVATLGNHISQLEKENLILRTEVTSFRTQEKKLTPVIDISLGDPIPQDTESRKVYVATTAGFFKQILEPKLKYMLSNLHNMLEERDSDRDFDLILKGVAYSFRDLIKWGEAMVNEQISNQIDNPEEDDVSEEDINILKEKLDNLN